jgi:hypothetical protein
VSARDGQPAYVADAVSLLIMRREIINATVLSAWQAAKRGRREDADAVAEGAGVVIHALAQLASPEVEQLVEFLRERAGLAQVGGASGGAE